MLYEVELFSELFSKLWMDAKMDGWAVWNVYCRVGYEAHGIIVNIR
jgi:hypothetical protein